MIEFRNQLIEAERNPDAKEKWEALNIRLIELSKALRESTPNKSIQPTAKAET
ncbi:hypothetical protein D3C81_2227230 [compost metagenome]